MGARRTQRRSTRLNGWNIPKGCLKATFRYPGTSVALQNRLRLPRFNVRDGGGAHTSGAGNQNSRRI